MSDTDSPTPVDEVHSTSDLKYINDPHQAERQARAEERLREQLQAERRKMDVALGPAWREQQRIAGQIADMAREREAIADIAKERAAMLTPFTEMAREREAMLSTITDAARDRAAMLEPFTESMRQSKMLAEQLGEQRNRLGSFMSGIDRTSLMAGLGTFTTNANSILGLTSPYSVPALPQLPTLPSPYPSRRSRRRPKRKGKVKTENAVEAENPIADQAPVFEALGEKAAVTPKPVAPQPTTIRVTAQASTSYSVADVVESTVDTEVVAVSGESNALVDYVKKHGLQVGVGVTGAGVAIALTHVLCSTDYCRRLARSRSYWSGHMSHRGWQGATLHSGAHVCLEVFQEVAPRGRDGIGLRESTRHLENLFRSIALACPHRFLAHDDGRSEGKQHVCEALEATGSE